MLTYIPVPFLFYFIFSVRVSVKNRVRDNRTRANHRYKFRAIGASSTGQSGLRYSFAVRTVSDWNHQPASCCCCWAGESSCLQRSAGQMCACSHAMTTTTISVILHEEVCWLFCKKDKKLGRVLGLRFGFGIGNPIRWRCRHSWIFARKTPVCDTSWFVI